MLAIALLNTITRFAAFDLGSCNPSKNGGVFFGLPHWWEYISTGHKDGLGNCVPDVKMPDGLWAIALAVIDILLRVAGIVAVVSIIIAGIGYITAAGNPDKISSSRRRIVNSLLGLALVLVAAVLVRFIGSSIG